MRFSYEQGDWGTERHLVLYGDDGYQLGARDPFWPAGIPASKRAREARLRDCQRAMLIAEARRHQSLPYPVADAALRDGRLHVFVEVPLSYGCGCASRAVMRSDHAPAHGGPITYPQDCLSCAASAC